MDHSETWAALQRLVGTWKGTGRGEFPTIESFDYREILQVSEPRAGAVLHYRQQTWRIQHGSEFDSHVETGFIGVDAAGAVEMLNAQGTDRVEVVRGYPTVDGDQLRLDLTSVALAHDERMVRSWRSLQLAGNQLYYTMGMATTAVPDGAPHLTGHLTRR